MKKRRTNPARSGQAMVEYVIVFALLLGVAFAAWRLFRSIRRERAQVREFVASEYP